MEFYKQLKNLVELYDKEYCDKQAYLAENTDTAVVNQVPIEAVEKMAGIQFFKN